MKVILHADKEWGIGKGNDLMFHLPTDMKFFREMTTGKVVVMGRKTLSSFPGGKPLKNRTNIVMSRTKSDFIGNSKDIVIVHSLKQLLAEVKRYPSEDVYIIGGASIYHKLIPYCTEAYVTRVDAIGHADKFVQNFDTNKNFKLETESPPIKDNGYTIRFCKYRNLSPKKY